MHPFGIYSCFGKNILQLPIFEKSMSQISSLLQCGVRKVWLHELLKRSILTNLASCSGNWRKIGPESHQYEIWFFQGCSTLEVKSRYLILGYSLSLWTSVNSADFLHINCAHVVRVWQVQIQANISLQNIQWYHFKRNCLSSLIPTSCWNWEGASWTKH